MQPQGHVTTHAYNEKKKLELIFERGMRVREQKRLYDVRTGWTRMKGEEKRHLQERGETVKKVIRTDNSGGEREYMTII